jgi:hypothetical protein
MTTPQDSPRRRKQKARRTKQLVEWRIKKAIEGGATAPANKTEKAAPKKAAAASAKKAK